MRQPLESRMLQVLLGPLVTALYLFGFYVLLHGHYSPGGGFQAGVIFGAALLLPLLVHGRFARRRGYLLLSQSQAITLGAIGVMVYALMGIEPMLVGRPFLDYSGLTIPADAAHRRSLGILGIETGVALAVAGSVVAIFRVLQEERTRQPKPDSPK